MNCYKCPYGKDDIKRRLAYYEKIAEERGVPNDIYGNMTSEDALKEANLFGWCDKTGGKRYVFGTCEDAFDVCTNNATNPRKIKRLHAYKRKQRYKMKLKHLYHISKNHYPSAVSPIDSFGQYNDGEEENTVYYKRHFKSSGRNSSNNFYKRYSNKKIRKYNKEIHRGGQYKKIFDYKYQIT